MKKAVRAKVEYNEETKKLNGHSNGTREMSPLSEEEQSLNTVNGETA